MILTKDAMGSAIHDFYHHHKAEKLRVFSDDFEEDEIPVDYLFRTYDEMPPLEQFALETARGKILDVGAGAGCHSLALQQMQRQVTAIDISPLAVAVMRERGVVRVLEQDFFTIEEKFDTILMLMNGIGIVGSVNRLPAFFNHVNSILSEDGQLLVESSDLCYLFEEENGIIYLPEGDKYYGELEYQMQYKNIHGERFPWLYADFGTLNSAAQQNGFRAEIIYEGEHYDYLARIVRDKVNINNQ